MPWAAAAAVVAAGIGAGAQSDAARSAANKQGDAAKMGTAEQRRQFDVSRAETAAWRESGRSALGQLDTLIGNERGGLAQFSNDPRYKAIYQSLYDAADKSHRERYQGRPMEAAQYVDPANYSIYMKKLEDEAVRQFTEKFPEAATTTNRSDPNFGALTRKFTMDDFRSDPVSKASFEFGLSEGEKAVERMFGARGLRRSGAAVKAATRFAADYTNTKAGESRDRFVQDQTNVYNKLAGISGTGMVTATNNANQGMQMGRDIAQLMVGEGNARGAATIAQGNAAAGFANNAGNAAQNAYWLNRAYPSDSSTPTSNFYYTGETAAGGSQYG